MTRRHMEDTLSFGALISYLWKMGRISTTSYDRMLTYWFHIQMVKEQEFDQ